MAPVVTERRSGNWELISLMSVLRFLSTVISNAKEALFGPAERMPLVLCVG